MVEFLIKNGVDIHTDNDYPLIFSVKINEFDFFKYLVKNGADIHARDDYALRKAIKKKL